MITDLDQGFVVFYLLISARVNFHAIDMPLQINLRLFAQPGNVRVGYGVCFLNHIRRE